MVSANVNTSALATCRLTLNYGKHTGTKVLKLQSRSPLRLFLNCVLNGRYHYYY